VRVKQGGNLHRRVQDVGVPPDQVESGGERLLRDRAL